MLHKGACIRNLIPFSNLHCLTKSFASWTQITGLVFWNVFEIGAYYASRAASSVQEAFETSAYSGGSEHENPDINWDSLGFTLTKTDFMYVNKCYADGVFEQGQLSPYGNIELNPSAGVLNYGQGLFEGLKAFRREDGRFFLFRPEENAMRMQYGAERMCMPFPSIDQFIDAVKQTALANKRWIPPADKGTLYIRPMLLGTGPILGVAPSPEYTFLVYASPVGNYFKEGSSPLSLYIEDEFHRATRGGVGGVKSITNYAPGLKALTRAKSRGYSDVIYLDSVYKKNLEEATACNIFVVKGNLISTTPTNGNILPGVTRKSVIDIARDHGYEVEERTIPVEELLDGDEVFCTGTAVNISPVGDITYQGKRVEYKIGGELVSQNLYTTLAGLQSGAIEDKKGWSVEIK